MPLKMPENIVCAQPQKWKGSGDSGEQRKRKEGRCGQIMVSLIYYIKSLKTTKNWISFRQESYLIWLVEILLQQTGPHCGMSWNTLSSYCFSAFRKHCMFPKIHLSSPELVLQIEIGDSWGQGPCLIFSPECLQPCLIHDRYIHKYFFWMNE